MVRKLKKDFIQPILVLVLICLFISGLLAFGNNVTEPIIVSAATERAELARKEIIPDADEFINIETDGLPKTVTEAYGTANGTGYVFMITSPGGYGGDIKLICGISQDGKIIGSTVLEHSETQGLGTVVFDNTAAYVGTDKTLAASVDAISGATYTSKAFKNGIMDALEAYDIVKGAQS